MTRQELVDRSEAYIRCLLKERIPPPARVYLSGSRSRRDHRWNSDYDLWIDADIPRTVIAGITDELEESFVPFKVDIVTTPRLDVTELRRILGDERLVDGMQNGRAQKFEYTTELCWKTITASATFTMRKHFAPSSLVYPAMPGFSSGSARS